VISRQQFVNRLDRSRDERLSTGVALDQQQMRRLVEFQHELAVNYGKLVAVSAVPPRVQAAFRADLGAQWTFLSDEQRSVIKQINILDETEGQ